MDYRSLSDRVSEASAKVEAGFGWLELNPTGKKAAVLLHGVTGGKDDMLVLAEQYVAQGYAVFCPDLPGHGQSKMIDLPDFAALGKWFDAFTHHLGRPIDLIVSSSYASAIIYQYLQMGFLSPNTHVILGCPTPKVAVMTIGLTRLGQLIPPRVSWYLYNIPPSRIFRTKYLYRGQDAASYKWLVESEKRKYWYIAPDVAPKLSAALFGTNNPYDLPPLPPAVQRRITVVIGERDNVINKAGRDYLHKIMPHATFASAGPAGHILHFESVDSLVRQAP